VIIALTRVRTWSNRKQFYFITLFTLIFWGTYKILALDTDIGIWIDRLNNPLFAVLALMRGVSIKTLQLILGHASIVTTQRYARLTDGAVRTEASRLYREQTVGKTVGRGLDGPPRQDAKILPLNKVGP